MQRMPESTKDVNPTEQAATAGLRPGSGYANGALIALARLLARQAASDIIFCPSPNRQIAAGHWPTGQDDG